MKTTISMLLAAALLAVLPSAATAQDYYFCGDSTYYVTVSNTKITIQFDSTYIGLDMGQFLGNHPCLSASVPPQDLGRNFATFALESGCTYAAAAANILPDAAVSRVLPVYDFPGENTDFAVTDLVSVKFDETLPVDSAEAILAAYGLHRADSSHFFHNYWWCALDDSIIEGPLQTDFTSFTNDYKRQSPTMAIAQAITSVAGGLTYRSPPVILFPARSCNSSVGGRTGPCSLAEKG